MPAQQQTVEYDIIVVGAGVAGCAVAKALGTDGRKILLVERDLSEPDRIVGELLQPGGMNSLKSLGLADVTEGIEALPCYGYAVIYNNEVVQIPYPKEGDKPATGSSFHYGRFIQNLRKAASSTPNVTVLEATVHTLVQDPDINKIIGVACTLKNVEGDDAEKKFFAPLTIVADGCFSKFRKDYLPITPVVKSHFVGMVLKDCNLPLPKHGHVCLVKPSPVLFYGIGPNETRVLVDIPGKLPSVGTGELKAYLKDVVAPGLPDVLQPPFLKALETDRLRSMPNSFLPPSTNQTNGLIILGDALNMRHPLTGGGMTVALADVVLLRELLSPRVVPSLTDTDVIIAQMASFHWGRKHHASVINILAIALYSLFAAEDDDNLRRLREACFRYFKLGGQCLMGPISLLSGLNPSPSVLIYHFFAVAFYAVYLLFAEGSLAMLPFNIYKAFALIYTACVVIFPVMWSEVQP